VLAAEIEAAKRRAKIEALDHGEKTVAESLGDLFTAPELAPGDVQLLKPFIDWAAQRSCRYCPAKPPVVAAYVLDRHKAGVAEDQIFDELGALEHLHDRWGLPNPVKTAVVDAAIERITQTRPPRSWPAADKALFATLDPQIRHRIATREQQRDTELRRVQTELAEKRKALKPNDEPKAVEQKEKVTENVKIP
jgi:hypothetical protein